MTVEQAIAVAGKFDWDWAAMNLLKAPLWAAYKEAKDPLWAAYKEAKAPLWAAYEEAKARTFATLYLFGKL